MSSSEQVILHYRRLWFLLGWLFVAAIFVLSLMPAPPVVPGVSDKLEHAFAYALLMSWFGQLGNRNAVWIIGWIGMGVLIEVLQGWGGHRYFDLYDMAANVTGVLIGWLILKSGVFNYLRLLEYIVRRK